MILCVGTTPTVQRTIVLDRLELDGVNRAVEVKEYASGKSVNVAKNGQHKKTVQTGKHLTIKEPRQWCELVSSASASWA